MAISLPAPMHSIHEEQARSLFGRRAGKEVTHQDAREIVANLNGFFGVLREWAGRKRQSTRPNKFVVDDGQPPNPSQHRNGAALRAAKELEDDGT